jgi:hypothetical protein
MKNTRLSKTIKPNHAFRQRGASLLEGIAYLGIAAIVILGAVSLLTSAFSSAQTNRGAEEIVALRTAVKKLYMGQSAGYGNNTGITAQLISANAVPKSLTVDTTASTITNAWNGGVTVTGLTSQFKVEYTNVPKDVCINLITSSAGWSTLEVNDTATQPTPADATAKCTGATNKIEWIAS